MLIAPEERAEAMIHPQKQAKSEISEHVIPTAACSKERQGDHPKGNRQPNGRQAVISLLWPANGLTRQQMYLRGCEEHLSILQLGAAGLDCGLHVHQLLLMCLLSFRQLLLQALHLADTLLHAPHPTLTYSSDICSLHALAELSGNASLQEGMVAYMSTTFFSCTFPASARFSAGPAPL